MSPDKTLFTCIANDRRVTFFAGTTLLTTITTNIPAATLIPMAYITTDTNATSSNLGISRIDLSLQSQSYKGFHKSFTRFVVERRKKRYGLKLYETENAQDYLNELKARGLIITDIPNPLKNVPYIAS